MTIYTKASVNWTKITSSAANPVGIAFGNGKWVVPVDEGFVSVSSDLVSWKNIRLPRVSGGVAFGNGKFVVGSSGKVQISLDGETWEEHTPTGFNNGMMRFHNGYFYSATNNSFTKSSDGITWTLVGTYSGSGGIKGVDTDSLGRWVVCTYNGNVFCSTDDGVTWTPSSNTFSSNQISTVAYGNGVWILTFYRDSLYYATSSNGIDWTMQPNPDTSGSDTSYWGIGYGGGLWTMVGNRRIFNSTDGTSWTSTPKVSTERFEFVTYANSTWLGAGWRGAKIKSSNGTSWSTCYSEFGTVNINAIGYGGGKFVVAASTRTSTYADEGGQIGTSTDGVTWRITRIDSSSSSSSAYDVLFANNLWICLVDRNIYSSTDGYTWTKRTSGSVNQLSVAYSGSLWVTVGSGGSSYTSTNGTSWTSRSTGTTTYLRSVAYGGGRWVAVGGNGKIITSTNGTSWGPETTITTLALYGVAYKDGVWVICGDDSFIATSTDGVNWTQRELPFRQSSDDIETVKVIDGVFVAAGDASIFTSIDGIIWERKKFPPSTNVIRALAKGGDFVMMGGDGSRGMYITPSLDSDLWMESEIAMVHEAGVWKEPKAVFVKDAGVWKEVYSWLPTVIGQPFGGGFYFGDITIGSDTYCLIIADKTAETSLRWKTANSATTGTDSVVDGWSNTNSMNNSSHPAAQYCRAYNGGGYTDWYLASKDETNQMWLNIPPGGASTPAIFKTGGAQALTSPTYHWTSTQTSTTAAWVQRFSNGTQTNTSKSTNYVVRPIRRVKRN